MELISKLDEPAFGPGSGYARPLPGLSSSFLAALSKHCRRSPLRHLGTRETKPLNHLSRLDPLKLMAATVFNLEPFRESGRVSTAHRYRIPFDNLCTS
jgi:hypothetical protein